MNFIAVINIWSIYFYDLYSCSFPCVFLFHWLQPTLAEGEVINQELELKEGLHKQVTLHKLSYFCGRETHCFRLTYSEFSQLCFAVFLFSKYFCFYLGTGFFF